LRRAALLATAAVALTLAGCHGHPANAHAGATTSTTRPPPTVQVEKLTGGTTTPYFYVYTVDYPQLAGLGDQAQQRAINADLTRVASDLVGDFVAQVTSMPAPTTTSTSTSTSTTTAPASASSSGPASTTSAPPTTTSTVDLSQRSELTASAETTLLDTRLASFRTTATTNIAGAAHPTNTVVTASFDLSTGRRLALADLFRAGADYLDAVSSAALAQLATVPGYDAGLARTGAAPSDANFARFSLTEHALEITFAQGQVGPYAIGMPRVTIPYSQLRPLLASPGPLDGRT